MNRMVLDTSTLILLGKIDLLEVLAKETRIEIPEAVRNEATRKDELLDAMRIRRLIDERTIQVEKQTDPDWIRTLEHDFRLGEGEAQAIALVKKKGV